MEEEMKLEEENHCALWCVDAAQAQEDSVCWKMLENNTVEGLLPFDYFYVDQQVCFRFFFQNLQRMEDYFQEKKAGEAEIRFICGETLRIMQRGGEYLLREKGYLFAPEWIFWSYYEKKLAVCYLTGRSEGAGDYQRLVEYLMEKTDHADQAAVALIYGLYDLVMSVGVNPEVLLAYLEKKEAQPPESKTEAQSIEKKEAKASDEVHEEKSQDGTQRSIRLTPAVEKTEGKLQGLFQQKQGVLCCGGTQREYAIGRRKKSDLYLPFEAVSRRQAVFSYHGKKLYLMDTGSKNGTFLNGKRLPVRVKVQCAKGDLLTFADVSYRLA